MSESNEIGIVVGVERLASNPLDFWLYVQDNNNVQLDDIVHLEITEEGEDEPRFIYGIIDEMKKNKHLNLPIIDIAAFSKILGFNQNDKARLFAFTGLENNKPITTCVVSLLGNKAFYHYAASTERGRETLASYGMIFNLIKELRNLSIDELDFGGISADRSSGVDFFKLRFNGEDLLKVGEFDVSKSKVYSYFFSKLLQFKKNI